MQNEYMMKKLTPIIIIAAILILGFTGFSVYKNSAKNKFITSAPFDTNQVLEISKFRSCVGENFSGYNEKLELEGDRSMKHSIKGQTAYQGSDSSVSIYSPFDGLITEVKEEDEGEGYQVWLSPKSAQSYDFIFFNTTLTDDFKKNSEVTAGQLIGYADLERVDTFEIALVKSDTKNGETVQVIVSPFEYMSSEVFSEYKNKGLAVEDLIISKEDRDKLPCSTQAGSSEDEWINME